MRRDHVLAGIYLGSQPPAGAGQAITVVVTTRGRIYGGVGLVSSVQLGAVAGPTIGAGPSSGATITLVTEN